MLVMGMGMTGLFAIDIVPWYDYTERFVGISGQAENWPYYLMDNSHPMDLNCVEKSVKERLENIIINHESSP
jgi:hypothetical protein